MPQEPKLIACNFNSLILKVKWKLCFLWWRFSIFWWHKGRRERAVLVTFGAGIATYTAPAACPVDRCWKAGKKTARAAGRRSAQAPRTRSCSCFAFLPRPASRAPHSPDAGSVGCAPLSTVMRACLPGRRPPCGDGRMAPGSRPRPAWLSRRPTGGP